jgi:hypothetical protein
MFAQIFPMRLCQNITIGGLIFDEIFLFIGLMLFIIIFVSYLGVAKLEGVSAPLLLIFIFCFYCFGGDSVLVLYVSYEASLVPIIYIILK